MRTGNSRRTGIEVSVVLLTLCLASQVPLYGQGKGTAAELVRMARPGLWVELEGTIGEDSSIQVQEIEFLTGDFMDDDWELKAKVSSVDVANNEFHVLSVPVRVTKDTDFDKDIKRLTDLQPEMLVEIEGTYLKDGIFLAKEIETTDKLKNKPKLGMKIEAVGKVGRVDETRHIITVMGIEFQITDKTEGKSPIE